MVRPFLICVELKFPYRQSMREHRVLFDCIKTTRMLDLQVIHRRSSVEYPIERRPYYQEHSFLEPSSFIAFCNATPLSA